MATPKGGYFTDAGEKVPSVTTIIGKFKEAGPLNFWAYKVGRQHEAAVWRNRISTWVSIHAPYLQALKPANFATLIGADRYEEIIGGKWSPEPECERLYDVVQKAADSGTLAHDAIEGKIISLGQGIADYEHEWPHVDDPETLKNAQNAYAQFLRWLDNTRITITGTELGGKSEKYKFGGTLDGLGKDSQGRHVLLDWKTSNAIYADYLIQLAAYALLLEENQGIKVEGFHIVRVAKETADFNHASFEDLEREKQIFLKMRDLYADLEILKKRVR